MSRRIIALPLQGKCQDRSQQRNLYDSESCWLPHFSPGLPVPFHSSVGKSHDIWFLAPAQSRIRRETLHRWTLSEHTFPHWENEVEPHRVRFWIFLTSLLCLSAFPTLLQKAGVFVSSDPAGSKLVETGNCGPALPADLEEAMWIV